MDWVSGHLPRAGGGTRDFRSPSRDQGGWGRQLDGGGWAGRLSGRRAWFSLRGRVAFLILAGSPACGRGPLFGSLLAQPLLDPGASGRLLTELAHSTKVL